MRVRLRSRFGTGNPLRRSCVSKARNAGEIAFVFGPARPSAEIVCVEGAKCRWDYVFVRSRATFCEDRACRRREMQVRLRFCGVARNPLRRSRVSKARHAGEITKIVCLEGCLLEWVMFIGLVAPRANNFYVFGNVSCETLVLEVYFLTFCECLVWNARFGSLPSHFLRMSRVKRSFWKLTFSLFLKPRFQTTFWRKGVWNPGLGQHFGGKRSETFQITFWRKGVWNLGFRPHFILEERGTEISMQ